MRGDRPGRQQVVSRSGQFTPHARGSTLAVGASGDALPVYPACAGIDPARRWILTPLWRLPRMRGDRPHNIKKKIGVLLFTPHARGSTLTRTLPTKMPTVYPACAGIDPWKKETQTILASLPRMRGDRPYTAEQFERLMKFTPHARGSTPSLIVVILAGFVYPACAGIDLCQDGAHYMVVCLPRMRGDRPMNMITIKTWYAFTPHARGSTRLLRSADESYMVYPACAGIDH